MHASHRLSKNCYNIVVILTKRLYRKVQFFFIFKVVYGTANNTGVDILKAQVGANG